MKYDKEIEEELNSIVIEHYLSYGIPEKPFYWYDDQRKFNIVDKVKEWDEELELQKYYQEVYLKNNL